MFGLGQQAKVPNTSQYDFKGASVTSNPLRSSHPPVPINPPLLELVMLDQPPEEQLADPSLTRAGVFPIS
jgi:hypothetical protein